MSYNGSGTFVINTAGQPVVSGTVISSTAFNALTADLATGLSTAITKDGQTTPTANIPMGNNKITGLAVGTAATDAANLSQVQSTTAKLITASGTDTVTGTLSPTLTAYAAGQMFYWVAAGTNTGAVTLNIDSLGAKAVTRDGSTALAAGDIRSGEVVVVVYDGTRFQVVSQINSSGDATFANVSITSALNVGGVSTFTGLITANGGVSGALNGTVGATTPNTGAFTTLTTSSTVTLNGGTANGVLYLNGSKVATSGSALTFDGSNIGLGITPNSWLSTHKALQGSSFAWVDRTDAIAGFLVTNAYRDSTTSNWTYKSTGVSALYQMGGQHIWSYAASGTAGTSITYSEGMRLDTSGNLGIGTSSPGYRLDVQNTAATTWARIGYATVNSGAGVIFNGASTQKNWVIANQYNVNGGLEFTQTTAGGGSTIGSTPAMVLDSSGNLGLGVTPSAWDTAYNTLQISSSAVFGNSASSNIGLNYYYNAGDKYITTGPASYFNQYNGTFKWFTAPSGTAGNAITFTQAATLDASGNFQVGGTAGGNRLRITSADNNGATVIARFESNNTNQAVLITFGGIYGSSGANLELGANATTKAVEIDQNKNVRVGTGAIATNATNGFLYVPTCAGTPTGTPTSFTGLAPIVIDSTNNKLYFYSNGQWRDAGP